LQDKHLGNHGATEIAPQIAHDTENPSPSQSTFPPDLSEIIAAWPGLPQAIKAGIVAMVKAAGREDGGR
jgi:hypothetical protein